MPILKTQAEAFALAKSAGFANPEAEIMAALAMAETFTLKDGKPFCDFASVGDTHLVDRTYGPSYGAWQIRSVKAQSGTGGYRDPAELAKFDPPFNAKAARSVYLAQGFRAWSTYNSGAYQGYMLKATYNPPPAVPPGSYIVTGGDTLSAIGQKTGHPWRDIAAVNKISGPRYTIYPGNVLLLPDFPYTVRSGDTLTSIAATVGSDLDWQTLHAYNKATVPNPNVLEVGQVLRVPRLRAA